MDDLSAKISEILGSQEGMKQVAQMAERLGLDPSQIGVTSEKEPNRPKEKMSQDIFDGIDAQTLLKVQRLVSKMNTANNGTALLDALKPYMGAERLRKIDDAKRIMQLIELIPLINAERETHV